MLGWLGQMAEVAALRALAPDGRRLLGTRAVRLFAYGLLSVVLALYLAASGLSDSAIGLLLTLTLVGDAAVSLWLTANADRLGRRRVLIVGAGLMVVAGLLFAVTSELWLLIIAAIVGTISPSGSEVGPCQAVEQAALPQTVPDRHRTQIFAWYNLGGMLATAAGALTGGLLTQALQGVGLAPLASYRIVLVGYALMGVVLALQFRRLSPAVEAPRRAVPLPYRPAGQLGLHRSRGIVLRLAALFMVDSFGGGLVLQSIMAYWLTLRFGIGPATLGLIFFGANLLAAISALAAARLAARIGLLNTMVWTHVPSNLLLMLVPLMPSLPLAIVVLLARFSLSQMDVPTRQSYLAAVVEPDERSAAAGLTGVARTLASGLAPAVTGSLLQAGLLGLPFLLSGGLKILYDLALWWAFRTIKPPEEQAQSAPASAASGQRL